MAMRLNPEAKMCPGKTIEKKIVRKAFADLLPESVAWRQKEQFSDGVGYSWIDTLKEFTSKEVSDEQMAHAAERFPVNPPRNKEEYYYRSILRSISRVRVRLRVFPAYRVWLVLQRRHWLGIKLSSISMSRADVR